MDTHDLAACMVSIFFINKLIINKLYGFFQYYNVFLAALTTQCLWW